jgi:hypothetical protein
MSIDYAIQMRDDITLAIDNDQDLYTTVFNIVRPLGANPLHREIEHAAEQLEGFVLRYVGSNPLVLQVFGGQGGDFWYDLVQYYIDAVNETERS